LEGFSIYNIRVAINTYSKETHPTLPRPNTELDLVEQPMQWQRDFNDGWLAHYETTGEMDWALYPRIENSNPPNGAGIDPKVSRLMLVTSAGVYLKDDQYPFDWRDPMGDYSLRLFSSQTTLEQLDFAHARGSAARRRDAQVLLPLDHLNCMVLEGLIGEIAPMVVSCMGYQPNALRVIKETVPLIVETAKRNKVDGAILVPAGEMDVQSMALVARALEVNRVASVMVAGESARLKELAPPRAVLTYLPPESPLGNPGRPEQQRRILETMVNLLSYHAPVPLIKMKEY
jgi:hypothetical protein